MQNNIDTACTIVYDNVKKDLNSLHDFLQKSCRRRRDEFNTRLDTVDKRVADIEKDFWEKQDTEDDKAD